MTHRLVTDEERRARLGIRHALAPSSRVQTPEDAARAVVCLHATEPATVHLSCWARTDGIRVEDAESALYESRTLIRQQAMRETLFVFPRDLVPAAWGSTCVRVGVAHRRRLLKDLERWGGISSGDAPQLLRATEEAILEHLCDGVPRSSVQVKKDVAGASRMIGGAPDRVWGGNVSISSKVLTQLGLDGVLARAVNDGPWYRSRPTWTPTEHWWNVAPPNALPAREGYAEIVHRWLWSYGPGTVEDIAWWLGATKTIVRTALDDLDAQPVALEDGQVGWLRHDDTAPVTGQERWNALLPLLDPAIMGWKNRDFLLGPHRSQLCDTVGNAGTTVIVDGRAVGAWGQDPDGSVRLNLLEEVDSGAGAALQETARELSQWLDGQQVFTVYPSPAMAQIRP